MTIKHENADNVNSILKSKVESTFSDLDKSQKSYKNYLSGFNTKATQGTYEFTFNKFVEWAKFKSYDSIIATDRKEVQQTILDYIAFLKKRGNRHGTIKAIVSAIRMFFIQNDYALNHDLIKRTVGKETKQLNGRRAYTLEQVQAMTDSVHVIRTKAIILTLGSCGMRKGAITTLRVRNLKRQSDGGALVVVYEGEKEEYVAGLTPEAVHYIDLMLDERRKDGLVVNEDNFIFTRNTYGNRHRTDRQLSTYCINNIMQDTIASAKVDRKQDPKTKRCEISTAHGLRKFFKTTCHSVKYAVEDKSVQAIQTVIIEQLMGHSQNTVKMTYLDTSEEELYAEYQKAIPALTITKEWRFKNQNEQLKEEINNAETEQMTDLKRTIAEMQVKLEETNPESVHQEAQVQYNSHLEDKVAELTAVVQDLVQQNQELTKSKAKTVKQTKPLVIRVEEPYSKY